MKELELPVGNYKIPYTAINETFKGAIIGYKDCKPIGIFQYDPDINEWFLCISVDTSNVIPQPDVCMNEFSKLLVTLLDNKTIDSCKVIEFE